jgi:hypothetical protein
MSALFWVDWTSKNDGKTHRSLPVFDVFTIPVPMGGGLVGGNGQRSIGLMSQCLTITPDSKNLQWVNIAECTPAENGVMGPLSPKG